MGMEGRSGCREEKGAGAEGIGVEEEGDLGRVRERTCGGRMR